MWKDTRLPGTGPVSLVMDATPAALALWSAVICFKRESEVSLSDTFDQAIECV
jgi:hypothetical protein